MLVYQEPIEDQKRTANKLRETKILNVLNDTKLKIDNKWKNAHWTKKHRCSSNCDENFSQWSG